MIFRAVSLNAQTIMDPSPDCGGVTFFLRLQSFRSVSDRSDPKPHLSRWPERAGRAAAARSTGAQTEAWTVRGGAQGGALRRAGAAACGEVARCTLYLRRRPGLGVPASNTAIHTEKQQSLARLFRVKTAHWSGGNLEPVWSTPKRTTETVIPQAP